ncbi:MAG: FAD-dependent oxidoreductase [Oscillospiraceae bacterium]
MQLKKVFEPIKIGNLVIKNRLVVSAMSSHLGNPDGTPNEEVTCYLEAKARGGWGLIFTEDLGVTVDAGCDPVVGSLWSDNQIPAWKETVRRVHAAGGLMGAQIYHAGRERSLKAYPTHPVAPSAIKEPTVPYIPRALTVDEIHDLVSSFAECARRVRDCGFDCVEIHGAHGYLLNQFMSPFANKRSDDYGGTLINRMRFPLEVVAAVRKVVGADFPIFFRMNTSDYVEGGIEVPEAIVMAKMLEEGGVDVLHCTQGTYTSKQTIIAPGFIPVMNYINNTAAIKAAVDIPVVAVGRFNDVYMSEAALRDGKADLIAMARASLADPELPNKAKEGRVEEIIHCIGCDQGCTGETAVGNRVNCIANPHTCRETVYDLSIVANPKKVFVAGAGVSGLAAAIGAAERGHKVTVFEASDELGGQWLAASTPPGKTEYLSLLVNYRNQIKQYGVEVRMSCPLTKELVTAEKPDAVILATGGNPLVLPIPGLDNSDFVKTPIDILRGRTMYGKNVVVAGGGLTGAETAVFLAVQGCNVTIVEMMDSIITDAVAQPKLCIMDHIKKYNIQVHTSTKLTKVGDGVVYAEEFGEPVEFKRIDMVVNAMGVRSNNPLEAQLADCGCKVVVVGDALKSKNGYKNIREGFDAGNAI